MIKSFIGFLLFILFAIPAFAGTSTVQLSWMPPTTNADGTPLTDLGGYKVYQGTSPGNYTQSKDVGNVTTYTVSGLPDGTYYYAVTAYDTSGNESDFSNEVNKKTDATGPGAPKGLSISIVINVSANP